MDIIPTTAIAPNAGPTTGIAAKEAYIIPAAITPTIAAIGANTTFKAVAAADPLDNHPVKLEIPLDI